jgi:hypothetical protein
MPTRPDPNSEAETGSASVELALIGGLLALLALGVVQLAFIGYAREAAGYAAHDALTEATAYGGDPREAQALGAGMLGQLTTALHHPQITVREDKTTASVTVTGQSTPLLGIAQTITVTDTGRIQTFGAHG